MYSYTYILKRLGNYKISKLKEILFIIAISFFRLLLAFYIKNTAIQLGIYYVVFMLSAYKIYSNKNVLFLNYFILTFIVFIFSDNIMGYLLIYKLKIMNYFNNQIYIMIVLNLSLITCFISISYLLSKLNLVNFSNYLTKEDKLAVFMYCIFIIISYVITLIFLNLYSQKLNEYFFILITIFSCILIVHFIIFFILNRLHIERIEKKHLEIYSNIIEKSLENTKKYKHDFNNILKTIEGYLQTEDIQGLKEYFYKQILKNYKINHNNMYHLANINDIPVKGLLSIKISEIIYNGIYFNLNILNEIEDFVIKQIDICRILGILIDNAIEASLESNDKTINLGIINDVNEIYIIISNSYKEKPKLHKLFEDGYSNKVDHSGLGLSIVKEFQEKKYKNIDLNTFIEDHLFHIELIIKR